MCHYNFHFRLSISLSQGRFILQLCWVLLNRFVLSFWSDGCNLNQIDYYLREDVSKYRPEVYKSEKSKILKKIHKVALGKLLT